MGCNVTRTQCMCVHMGAHSFLPSSWLCPSLQWCPGHWCFIALGIFAVVPCDTSEESCVSGPADPLCSHGQGPRGHRWGRAAALQVLTPAFSPERRVRLCKAGCNKPPHCHMRMLWGGDAEGLGPSTGHFVQPRAG